MLRAMMVLMVALRERERRAKQGQPTVSFLHIGMSRPGVTASSNLSVFWSATSSSSLLGASRTELTDTIQSYLRS